MERRQKRPGARGRFVMGDEAPEVSHKGGEEMNVINHRADETVNVEGPKA